MLLMLTTSVTCCSAPNVQFVCVGVVNPNNMPFLALNAQGDWTGHCYICYSTVSCSWLHTEKLKFEAKKN